MSFIYKATNALLVTNVRKMNTLNDNVLYDNMM